jgi:ABC-type uncharacterized transport system involved in gliding motility auxiliary subunit
VEGITPEMKGNLFAILGLIGLAALGAGLILVSSSGQWTGSAKILAAVGAVLVVLFLAAYRSNIRALLGKRSTAYGANVALVFVLLIAILTIVNVIADRNHRRFDLTHSGMYSLAPQTVKLLKGLDKDVSALAFFKDDNPDKYKVEDLLNEYKFVSSKFSVRFIDPDKNPGITKTYGVKNYGTIVLESGGKTERVVEGANTKEESVTNALLKVIREGKKKIYFVEGHGEGDIDNTERTGYSQAKTDMENENYEVAKLFLMREQEVPEDCSLLVVCGPKKEFLESELQTITRYLDHAGKALFMLDPAPSAGLKDFLKNWRVDVGDNVVVDVSPAGRLFGVDEFMPMAMSYPEHAITKDFDVATLFPYARSVSVSSESVPGVTAQSIVETGAQSWAETGPTTGDVRFDPDVDKRGPISLAVAVTAEAKAAQQDTTAGEPGKESTPSQTRIVVVGDSDFANNSFITFSGDSDFFLNIVSWLAEQEDLISIRPKAPEDRRINLTAAQTRVVMYLSLLVLPLAVLATGVGVWLKRR